MTKKEFDKDNAWLNKALDEFTIERPSPDLKGRILRAATGEKRQEPGRVIQFTGGKKFTWPVLGTSMAAALALALVLIPGSDTVVPTAPVEVAAITEQAPLVTEPETGNPLEIAAVAEISEQEEAEVEELLYSLLEEQAFEEELLGLL